MSDQDKPEYLDLPETVKEGDMCPSGDGGTLKLEGG